MFGIMFENRTFNVPQYVYKFSSSHQIVQTVDGSANAKVFKTRKGAENFIKKYSDAGYGMSAKSVVIVKL